MSELSKFSSLELLEELSNRGDIEKAEVGKAYSPYEVRRRYSHNRNPVSGTVYIAINEKQHKNSTRK